ncbi:hypothetical protein SAMN05443549_101301 [Flavobacterium fluvii]|uniref:Lipoprotein n=1 Tax=Flavobacterium fluvii TaxID=468056 RepID=A0A1M5EE17_9FLAO|nr:hypothetical protein [Flavobacterium fluvii]SHF77436.1 hypothetical protein SAMN05443549_101301 [Flavobacterium fluvii]
MRISSFLVICLMFLLTSCDLYTGSFVVNSSSEKITIDIKYNQNNEMIEKYVKHHNGFEGFVKFIRDYYNSSKGNLIKMDSSKYTATIELNKKDTLRIWGGIHQSNDFDEIEEIVIRSNKKQTTIKGEDFQDVFDKNGSVYIYTVQ